jgi:hypothetical protein
MSDPILNILQGESVYYNPDSTVGATASYFWTFPGGTPANSTDHYPVVTYSNIGDYNASLQVTDIYGTARTLTKFKIINVDKNVLTVDFTVPGSPVRMNELFSIIDTSFPTPTDWEWILPGFGTIPGVQDLINYEYDDWFAAVGTYAGAPGATADIPVQLTASTNFDIGTKIQDMTVQKLGGGQDLFDLTNDWVTTYGPTAYVLTSVLGTSTGSPIFLNAYGLTGASGGMIVVVDLSATRVVGPSVPGTGFQNNDYFHVNQEIAQYNGHFGHTENPAFTKGLTGYVIVNPQLYQDTLFLLNDPIINGDYFLKGYVNVNRGGIFADRGGFLTRKWLPPSSGGRSWPLRLMNEFLLMASPVRNLSRDVEEPYIALGGTGGGSPALLYTNVLNTIHGNNTISSRGVVAIPSSQFILTRANPAGDMAFRIDIRVHWSNGVDQVQTTFDASAGPNGNDGFLFFKAQDSIFGPGIATALNQSITNYFTPFGMGIPIRVKTSPDYNPYFVEDSFVFGATAYNNREDYHGILIEATDPTVFKIEVTDNSPNIQWTVPVPPSIGVGLSGPAAFPSDWQSPFNQRFGYASWLGSINDQMVITPTPGLTFGPSGGWFYGGSL